MMAISKAKQKRFDREVESIRQMIQAAAKPFPDDKKAQRARKRRGEQDLEYFNRTYFPHYFSKPSSRLHKYFADRYPGMIERSMRMAQQAKGFIFGFQMGSGQGDVTDDGG